MSCTTLDLREKDVINTCNGQKLGRVGELEIDVDCGKVTALIVVPDGICSLISSRHHVRVPWEKIEKIGKDTILVELPFNEIDISCGCEGEKSKKEKKWWNF